MEATPANTIAFIAYGRNVFRDGAKYSFLTARHFECKSDELRYVVYTDRPLEFSKFDIIIETIDEKKLEVFSGGNDYIHRRTIAILKDALQKYGGSVALVDTDTYFRKSPQKLFDRIGPGQACLHVFEARLKDCGSYADDRLLAALEDNKFFDRNGVPLRFNSSNPMWNAGVIGMNANDIDLLDDILFVIDEMWVKVKVANLQQFVTGSILSARLSVNSAFDVVFHYWEFLARKTFEARLPLIIEALDKLPPSERASRAYALRPRGSLIRNTKNAMRRFGRRIGFRCPGIVKSV